MSESKLLLQVKKDDGWVTVAHLPVIDGILQESPNNLVRLVYPAGMKKLEEIKLATHLEKQ